MVACVAPVVTIIEGVIIGVIIEGVIIGVIIEGVIIGVIIEGDMHYSQFNALYCWLHMI